MKKSLFNILVGIALVLILANCSNKAVSEKSGLPPGQQKKLFGSQSAAPFAPGQTKKQSAGTPAKAAPGQVKKQATGNSGKSTSSQGQSAKEGKNKK